MKRTLSVNIKGTNFIIEEDGHELLQNYLERLERSLKNEEGKSEIIEDIEYRVAELFSGLISQRKTVIELIDVQTVISTLGQPEDFIDEGEQQAQEPIESLDNKDNKHHSRKFFRDEENGRIAGVCSGLALYFNIDVMIVRAIFLIVFFFGAFSIPVYIILWIITPKIKSNVDRLKMQGKAVTVDSLKEEIENAANKLKKQSNSFAHRVRNNENIHQNVSGFVRILSAVIGVGILIASLSLLIPLITFVVFDTPFIPAQTDFGFISFSTINELLLETDLDIFWMKLSVLLIGFSIVVFMILLSLRFIFHIKNKGYKFLMVGLFIFGIIGVISASVISIKTVRFLSNEAEIEREVGQVDTPILSIYSNVNRVNLDANFKINMKDGNGFITILNKQIYNEGIKIEYRSSRDSLYHVYQKFSANSYAYKTAIEKAKHIKHGVTIVNNELHIDTDYSYPLKDKLRDQEVTIIIEIPKGKRIHVQNSNRSLSSEAIDFDEDFDFDLQSGFIDGDGYYEEW